MASTSEAGVVSVCTGGAIFLFGAVAVFDKALMTAGNLLIIAGAALLLRSRSLSLFEPDRMLGTAVFALGVLSLALRLTVLGFLLESVGLVYIFRRSVPSFKAVLFRLVYGKLLKTA